MGLNQGGSTFQNQQNTNAQNLGVGQIQSGLSASGGPAQFAGPNNLYNLSPGENLFRALQTGASMPGSLNSQAQGYMQGNPNFSYSPAAQQQWSQGMAGMSQLTDPSHGLFHNYLDQFIRPQTLNDSIARGFGGNSGASGEAVTRAMADAAMKYGMQYPGMVQSGITLGNAPRALQQSGLQNWAQPLANQDYNNLQTGLSSAGMQRQSSILDLARTQQLMQSLVGQLPTTVRGYTQQNQGAGAGASVMSGLGALGTGLMSGGNNSMLMSLLGSGGPGGGAGGWANSIANLFRGGGNPATNPSTASNFFTGGGPNEGVAPMLTDNNMPSWSNGTDWSQWQSPTFSNTDFSSIPTF